MRYRGFVALLLWKSSTVGTYVGTHMNIPSDSEHDSSLEETRLVVETLVRAISGTEIVAVVTNHNEMVPGISMEPLVDPKATDAFERIYERIQTQLEGKAPVSSFSCVVTGVEWGVLVDVIEVSEQVVGALIVARHGRTWSKRESSLTRAFASLLSHVATLAARETALLEQRRLDELVTDLAEHLMATTAANHQATLDLTVRKLGEFLGSDAAFLRRNDHARGLSVLVAEWPPRENIPEPDPLGEVAFDADPIFMATKDLRVPYMPEPLEGPEEYFERIKNGSGVSLVGGGAVPLLIGDSTWGVLGFIHFGLHRWVPAEVHALQAVASMLVQLQARIDAEELTNYNANHDYLTGLPNRRALVLELEKRLRERSESAILVIDLDRFKIVNDYLGHSNGDLLLMAMADRLRTSIRTNDFVARLGGDEFVFLVDKATSELDAVASAYRILDVLGRPVELAGQVMHHTASIGIAMSQANTKDPLALLSKADVAMFTAKSRGRNQVVVFDNGLSQLIEERSEMEIMLREAIDTGGLRLHYHPEIELTTGRLLAVEALVRWEHPTRGLLAASEFIKVAEETGLVTSIGRWVFSEACRQLSEWRHSYPHLDFAVRVNMSPADFKFGDLVEFVETRLRENNVPGSSLCIEITEHVVVDEPEETARILCELQNLGVVIALDDFGTGFASMTELKNLPVEILKLDMTFVRGIVTDSFDRAIVESIIRLASALNLEIVAEGIETREVVEKLVEMGCYRGQGYLLSIPMAAHDLKPLLDAGSVPRSLLHATRDAILDAADNLR